MTNSDSCCHICGATRLSKIPEINRFVSVSSDIRVVEGHPVLAECQACGVLQKVVDPAWQESVRLVYAGYNINHQSGGADPVIFRSVYGPGPRADILVQHLGRITKLKPEGILLDIGCGNGNILRSFGAAYPGWSLFGMENSMQWRDAAMSISGVRGFYTDLDSLGELRADIIVMSHVLEHIPDPSNYLRRLQNHLNRDGMLFIAVPDIRQNPVDLFVLDHCTHFDAPALERVIARGGFVPHEVHTDILGKEIVALGHAGILGDKRNDNGGQPYSMPLEKVAEKYLSLCADLQQSARDMRARYAVFGVMGTSTAAAWIAGELDMHIDFFVDEDPLRVGKTAFGRPILSLAQVPPAACVFIPMSSSTAEGIVARAARADVAFSYLPWNQIEDVAHKQS